MSIKRAFTLAEVLLTLTIIGVIAAITVPSLLKKTDESELVAGCLKAYSTLSNAVTRMSVDYGKIGRGVEWTNGTKFMNNLQKYMNISKKCTLSANYQECFAKFSTLKKLNGSAAGNMFTETSNMFITTDGIAYAYYPYTTNSTTYNIASNLGKGIFGRFVVDVNGPQKPNIYGLDLYCFIVVKERGIVPCGAGMESTCNQSSSGTGCAAKVINSRKIDYVK